MAKIEQMDGLPPLNLQSGAVLEKGCVYVIPLLEHLKLPNDVRGAANPKSSTGRLDVLTRLITNYGVAFDKVPVGYQGQLYVEVAPATFSIVVREGSRLNQLRLQRGSARVSKEKLVKLTMRGRLFTSLALINFPLRMTTLSRLRWTSGGSAGLAALLATVRKSTPTKLTSINRLATTQTNFGSA